MWDFLNFLAFLENMNFNSVKDTFWNILTFTDDASDAYIDKVLENLRQAIADNGLDPADLPNGEVGFSETILGITFHGKAEVHDGFFQGTGYSFSERPFCLQFYQRIRTKILNAILKVS